MPPKEKATNVVVTGDPLFDPRASENANATQSEAVIGGAGDPASLARTPTWIGMDLASGPSVDPFAAEFPKLSALCQAFEKTGQVPTGFRVISSTEGFRRGGVRHPKGSTEYPTDHFDPVQIEIMLGEPVLTVELI